MQGFALGEHVADLQLAVVVDADDVAGVGLLRALPLVGHEHHGIGDLDGHFGMFGPILRDRLFWAAGVSVLGQRNTMVQSFHHRVDADDSGNIATEEFASQSFRTGQVQGGYQLGLDWHMTPRHQLRATVGGNAALKSNEDLEVVADITEQLQIRCLETGD